MSVSAIASGASGPPPQQAPVVNTKTADGDYKARSAKTAQSKDSDGDFKPVAAAGSPAATSSSNVQAVLNSLTKGG